jgi:hypothetical protein
MAKENAVRDDNRHAVLLGNERAAEHPVNFELILQDDKRILPVAMYSYNPVTLAWEAGVNLVYDGDLTLNMGDVERGVTDSYWRKMLYDYDGSGNLIYKGLHVTYNAADSDTGHLIFKYTYTGENLTMKQIRFGSWTGRTTGW